MNVLHLSVKDLQHVEILVNVAVVSQKARFFDHDLRVDIVDQQMSDQVLGFGLVCLHRLLQRLLNVHVKERVGNFLANQQLGGITPRFTGTFLEIKQIVIELYQFLLQGHGCLGAGGGNSHDRSHAVLTGLGEQGCFMGDVD